MNRRDAIKRISGISGLVVSLPYLTGILNGCTEKKPPAWGPLDLTERERSVLRAVSDGIIPPTDTPGAVDAGVPDFIETLLKDVFPVKEGRALLSGLEAFNRDCKGLTGNEYIVCSPSAQAQWLKEVSDPAHKHYDFFGKMHELVVGAYFTSEKGMKQSLNYVPIPEKFEGCLPSEKDARLMVGNRL